jgi:hypothetical protein
MTATRGVFNHFDEIRVRVELSDGQPNSDPTKVWLLEMGPFTNTEWSLNDLANDLRPIFEGTVHMISQTKKAVHWGASGGWGEVALVVSTAFATQLSLFFNRMRRSALRALVRVSRSCPRRGLAL